MKAEHIEARPAEVHEELELLLQRLPPHVRSAVESQPDVDALLEVVLDLASALLATEQSEELEALAAALPVKAQRRSNLVALAGRLSAEELDALTYYVSIRYKVEIAK